MNPPDPSDYLVSPLIRLYPLSSKLINSIQDGRTSDREKIAIEQSLWNEVEKSFQLNDKTFLLYLVGFYNTLLYQVWAQKSTRACDDSNHFQYLVLTRLGDLNRFIEQEDVADYYHRNARSLFPKFADRIQPKKVKRKQTRNIALQSILMLHGDEDN